MKKTFVYTEIKPTDVIATDLRSEALTIPNATAYRITIYSPNDELRYPEQAEALYANGRLGIAWGADATWADVRGVEEGIEMWLNDQEAWEAAN
jgi:hypothetical protein